MSFIYDPNSGPFGALKNTLNKMLQNRGHQQIWNTLQQEGMNGDVYQRLRNTPMGRDYFQNNPEINTQLARILASEQANTLYKGLFQEGQRNTYQDALKSLLQDQIAQRQLQEDSLAEAQQNIQNQLQGLSYDPERVKAIQEENEKMLEELYSLAGVSVNDRNRMQRGRFGKVLGQDSSLLQRKQELEKRLPELQEELRHLEGQEGLYSQLQEELAQNNYLQDILSQYPNREELQSTLNRVPELSLEDLKKYFTREEQRTLDQNSALKEDFQRELMLSGDPLLMNWAQQMQQNQQQLTAQNMDLQKQLLDKEEKTLERKWKAYEEKNKSPLEQAQNITSQRASTEQALTSLINVLDGGDINLWKEKIGSLLNMPEWKNANAAEMNGAVKRFFLSDLAKLHGGRINQLLEKRILDSLPSIYNNPKANQLLTLGLSVGHHVSQAVAQKILELDEYFRSIDKPVPSDLGQLAYKELKPYIDHQLDKYERSIEAIKKGENWNNTPLGRERRRIKSLQKEGWDSSRIVGQDVLGKDYIYSPDKIEEMEKKGIFPLWTIYK